MRAILLPILNFVSAWACVVIGAVLTMELGFVVSIQNRELYSTIHFYLMVYFLIDVAIRLIFAKNRRTVFLARGLDWLILLPLLGRFVTNFDVLNNYVFVQFVLLAVLVGRLPHVNEVFRRLKFNPTQIILVGFVLAIFVGALLLSLPLARNGSGDLNFIDAVFTATSAVCVTGLLTKNIGTVFSGFGQGVILLMIQLGGLGIMTFYALVNIVLHRRVSRHETMAYQETLLTEGTGDTFRVIKSIFLFTFLFEIVGMLTLFLFWYKDFETISQGLYFSAFHAISAFCNAGFSLFSNSLTGYADNPGIILSVATLIIIGGIGFPVIFNLYRYWFRKKSFALVKFQTKITLLVTGVLLTLGTVVIFFGEFQSGFAHMPLWQKGMMAFFHSVSSRTAGFNAVDLGSFQTATLWALVLLMFVGASPGSTGGGIKTTTFGVLLAALWRTIQGRFRIEWMGRTITSQDVYRAVAIIMVSVVAITTFLYAVLLTQEGPFFRSMFETVSAFGTVGLSLGGTGQLTPLGKILVIAIMFIGRVGPLTFAFALARRKPKANYGFPEESILLG